MLPFRGTQHESGKEAKERDLSWFAVPQRPFCVRRSNWKDVRERYPELQAYGPKTFGDKYRKQKPAQGKFRSINSL